MPSPLIHTSLAFAAGHQCGREREHPLRMRDFVALVFASNAHDLDFIPGLFTDSVTQYHHLASHSLLFCIVLALGCYAVTRRLFVPLLLVSLSHPIIDLLTVDLYCQYTTHWGIPLLWPFSDKAFWPVLPVFACPYVGGDMARLFSWDNVKVALRELVVVVTCALVYAMCWRGVLFHRNNTK